jgi:hypothetical protein
MEPLVLSSPQWSPSRDDSFSAKGFTCLACGIEFHTADLQRQHYRTDWYSLIRGTELMVKASIQFEEKNSGFRACAR